jgi:hypothetical protein
MGKVVRRGESRRRGGPGVRLIRPKGRVPDIERLSDGIRSCGYFGASRRTSFAALSSRIPLKLG